MKRNLLVAPIALLILLWFMSSCGSRTELIKRHYTKGFYVAGNSYRPGPFTQPNSQRSITKKVIHDPAKSQKNENGEAMASAITSCKDEIADPADPGSIRKRAMPGKIPDRVTRNQLVFTPIIQLYDNSKLYVEAKAATQNGYSLLWIIVVVLLIFWLLGFLTGGVGIGNLINLLLVVALILLILWLLKVL